ncbi:hypothetical protein PBCVCVR1_286L [Paramecium bursaria Chlorella virus CVR-1]|uniref:Uncharacterized protein n=1 Tax=Paramecium bursaria Chlorella virus CVA-1 TaxID=42683 RepID=M1HVM1_9PHYC|nr:hypothetical protein F8205_gp095 [Paramecium bursaria Chlorella virus CVA-1]AGE50450.1 hypothetical protein PBCVCVA1_279L [Paramecium bursaria Chlorella virus CVA-1]AGE52129.1 hypothetical protein PBCVCVR1_286L [Paramecium bursaria Chlorella virus CVR-1]
MSCSIEKILDPQTQKNIDTGVENMSVKIKKTIAKEGESFECQASQIDRTISLINIVVQYIILAFVILALVSKEHSGLIVKVIQWTTYISLGLLAVQYRNIIVAAGNLVGALDMSTKIIIFLSIAAAIGTGYIKKGQAGMQLTIAIALVLFIRLSLQMRDFIISKKSRVPAFLIFLKELLTPQRIETIYNSF